MEILRPEVGRERKMFNQVVEVTVMLLKHYCSRLELKAEVTKHCIVDFVFSIVV